MMVLERLPPSPSLRSLVFGFEERSAHFGQTSLTHPLPARPDLFIEIYLAEAYRVSHRRQDFETSPQVALVGPHGVGTTRLLMSGEIKAFSIRFQPGAIHRLIRFDMNAAAERWLGNILRDARPLDRIDIAGRILLESGGQKRIDGLAEWAGLSERQFTRRFAAQVGLNPKLYARAIRLNALLKTRRSQPQATWTELTHAAGYADQAHFVRECRDLTGSSPSAFFADWTRIPST
jgi:AraC-like DNA-binding protein